MEAIRPIRAQVRRFILPVACLACIVWVGIFVLIFTHSPHHNIGIATLIVFGASAVVLPWLGMALSVFLRPEGKGTPPTSDR